MRFIRWGRAAVVGLTLCGPAAYAAEPESAPKPSLWQRVFGSKDEVEPRAKMAPPPVLMPKSAREEEALYMDRLRAIQKLRVIAVETRDEELENEVNLLEKQLGELTKHRMELLKSSEATKTLDKALGASADPRSKPSVGRNAAANRGNK